MDYFEIEKIMESVKEKLIEPADDSSIMMDYAHKLYNQGVTAMFQQSIFEIMMAIREKEGSL